jgi:long-chain acyl-CoA synthetase
MMDITQLEFALIPDLIAAHARNEPQRLALTDPDTSLSYGQLDALMDRIAASLQAAGLVPGESIAICATSSVTYAAVFLGALRAGIVVAPLAPGSPELILQRMLEDSGARLLFTDMASSTSLNSQWKPSLIRIALDGSGAGIPLSEWLPQQHARPEATPIGPAHPLNIIYSSGTTGEPKGIVQPHGMRWAHVRRGAAYGYGPQSRTLLSTPLYSNTTLVVFFPAIAFGGSIVLMPKFEALAYLKLAQARQITHTMLVPVQYQRIMARLEFDTFDLSHFFMKFSTSAPFSAALKADVLQRWPGGLVEFYGMTEGGGTCILEAHRHPGKLHTVGQPAAGHDIRLIDEQGRQVPTGEAGEVVGHSAGMMQGYHRQPEKTREAEWFNPEGKRFIRTGDIGRFDEQGFLTLFDRKKDMIISGGFNIYPSDLEAELKLHPDVHECAVVGVPSDTWGETPVAFVVSKPEATTSSQAMLEWLNSRVGKTQRLSGLNQLDELPRSAIGKVLKRELRETYQTQIRAA